MDIDFKSFEGFIFDMDGVIVDNYTYHIEAWGKFCRKHGLEFDGENFTKKYFGKNNADILQALLNKTITHSEIQELGEEKEAIYRDIYRSHIKPLNGLIDFMKTLKIRNKKIALASSAPQSNIDFVVESIDIKRYIDAIVNGNMVKLGKPNPHIFLKAAELLELEPTRCVVFEDSFSGVQAALNAGMQVFAVATTHKKEEHNPDNTIIEDFAEIVHLI